MFDVKLSHGEFEGGREHSRLETCKLVDAKKSKVRWWCTSRTAAQRKTREVASALNRASKSGSGHRLRTAFAPSPHYYLINPDGIPLTYRFFFPDEESTREFENGADHFVVETRGPFGVVLVPQGHEVLTRRAAAGLPLTSVEVSALVEGVRRVDTVPLWQHFRPDQQKRHALRRELCARMGGTLSEIRNHFIALHARALRAGSRLDAMRWIGEALHLLQDSFSEAHTARTFKIAGPPHPIQFVRYFGPRGRPFPVEHRVLPAPDPRDVITVAGGRLKPAAAHSAVASREFLGLMLRHLGHPTSPAIAPGLRAFMNRHLVLSPSPTEPVSIYPSCPR